MELHIYKPKLHKSQKEIIKSNKRFKVARCGRRFGKTMLASYWLALREGSAVDGYPVAYFAPRYKLLLDVWAQLNRVLRPIVRRANKTEMRMELTTDGVIDFWTLEDKDAARGRKYKRLVIDEAAHAPYLQDAWEQSISPTLTDYEGDAWFISTPKGMNFFKTLHDRMGDPQFPDWESFHMPSTMNPHIKKSEIEARRFELPELVYRQEYLAEFVTFGAGLVKPDYIILGEQLRPLPIVFGIDLAISEKAGADYTAIAVMSRSKEGMIYLIDIERRRCGFNEIIEWIKAMANKYKPTMIAIEKTQYQAAVIQELSRTTRLPVRGIVPDRDKVTRFLPVLTRYEQGNVRHSHNIPGWFRDEVLAFPNGEHDDGVDAMAYAFQVAIPPGSGATLKAFTQPASKWMS